MDKIMRSCVWTVILIIGIALAIPASAYMKKGKMGQGSEKMSKIMGDMSILMHDMADEMVKIFDQIAKDTISQDRTEKLFSSMEQMSLMMHEMSGMIISKDKQGMMTNIDKKKKIKHMLKQLDKMLKE